MIIGGNMNKITSMYWSKKIKNINKNLQALENLAHNGTADAELL